MGGAKGQKQYPLNQSPLFKLRSLRRLGLILGVEAAELRALAVRDDNYRVFTVSPKKHCRCILGEDEGGVEPAPLKLRTVEAPKAELERAHVRLFKLLRRIQPPEYLHSGVKGRSYISNARVHRGAKPLIKIDIRRFYPSTSADHVRRFFQCRLRCSQAVSALLTSLTTVDGHLPTGSCLSQQLAFLTHQPLFDRLDQLARNRGATMTCYVDDITISGVGATGSLLFEVKREIHSWGLRHHKAHVYPAALPKVVTGVVLVGDEMRVLNRQHARIHRMRSSAREGFPECDAKACMAGFIGRLNAAAQVDEKFRYEASMVSSSLRGGCS